MYITARTRRSPIAERGRERERERERDCATLRVTDCFAKSLDVILFEMTLLRRACVLRKSLLVFY